MKKQQAVTLFMALALVCACSSPDAPQAPVEHRTVLTSILGQVIDSVGSAVAGAVVRVGDRTEITDDGGCFVMRDVRVRHDRCVVETYLHEHYAVYAIAHPHENGLTSMCFMPRYAAPSMTGSSMEIIRTSAGSASLTVPAGTLANQQGRAYEYDASVALQYLDPSTEEFAYVAPGGTLATAHDRSESIVQPIAVVRTIVYGEDNLPLQLRAGATAQLEISVPTPDLPTAKLYRYDRTRHSWTELHGVRVEGGALICDVTSLDDWLVAKPSGGIATLYGTVKCDNGTTLPGVVVHVNGTHAIADEHGVYRMVIPARQLLTVSVRPGDNRFISAADRVIGPAEPGSSTLHDVVVSQCPPMVEFKLVGCDSMPVPGMVWLSGAPYRVYGSMSGAFRVIATSSMDGWVSARGFDGVVAPTRRSTGVLPGAIRDGGAIALCNDTTRPFRRINLSREEDAGDIALNPTGTVVAVMSRSYVTCYDVATGGVIWRVPTPVYGGREPTLFFTRTGDKVAFSSDLGCFILSAATGQLLARSDMLGHQRLTSDASRLWIVPNKGKLPSSEIRAYDMNTNTLIRTMPLMNVPAISWFIGLHQDRVALIRFPPRQDVLLFDLDRGDTTRVLLMPDDHRFAGVAQFGSRCLYVVQRSGSEVLVIYDLESMQEVRTLTLGETGYSLRGLSADGTDIVTYRSGSFKHEHQHVDAPYDPQVVPGVGSVANSPKFVFSGDRQTIASYVGLPSGSVGSLDRYIYVYRLK